MIMWTCRSCQLAMMFKAVQPEVDGDGYYFICIGCGHRNALVNVSADPADHTALAQPEE